MKKYLAVVTALFFFSICIITFLCTRDKIYLEEFNQASSVKAQDTTPFPLTKETWPKDLVWKKGMDQPLFASPKATKGGIWNTSLGDFPPTFRQVGPEGNSSFRSELEMGDMGLILLHPNTQAILPGLASEWAVGKDNKTVYFKINPDAKWDDGNPVIADDFIFKLKMMRSPGILDPWYNTYYSSQYDEVLKFDDRRIAIRMQKPLADIVLKAAMVPYPYHFHGQMRRLKKQYGLATAIDYLKRDKKPVPAEFSKMKTAFDEKVKTHGEKVVALTKEIKASLKKDEQLDEKLAAAMKKLPAPKEPKVEIEIDDVIESWVKHFNWKLPPRCGPYNISSFIKGKEVVMKRNDNWWAKDYKYNKNRFNVDYIKYRILRDTNIAFEHFLKGELDQFALVDPTYWHSKAKYLTQCDRGYIQKIWFYTDSPQNSYQISMNTSHNLLKNKDIRLGIIHSLNIQGLIDTVLHGDYERAETFNEGYGEYTNTKIRARHYNLKKSIEYFEKAGYDRVGDDGVRINKANKRLSFKFLYPAAAHTTRLVYLKNEAKRSGLELVLTNYSPSAVFQTMSDKKHELAWHGWGAQFRPQYFGIFHKENANKKKNNNFSNLVDDKVSAMIVKYREGINTKSRIELAHKIEERLLFLAGTIPTYKVPYFRQGLWRWVKYPDFMATKDSELIMDDYGLFWIDEELKAEIQAKASKNETIYGIKPLLKNERYRKKISEK